jgi:hypothetical protein
MRPACEVRKKQTMSSIPSGLPYHLRLAMLAQNICIDRACRDSGFGRYGSTKACRIEVGTAADNVLFRKAREFEGEVGQDIDWVGDQEQDGGLLQRLHVIDHAAQDVAVAVYEIRTRFAYEC